MPLEKDELPEALRQDLAEAIREAMRKLPPKEQVRGPARCATLLHSPNEV